MTDVRSDERAVQIINAYVVLEVAQVDGELYLSIRNDILEKLSVTKFSSQEDADTAYATYFVEKLVESNFSLYTKTAKELLKDDASSPSKLITEDNYDSKTQELDHDEDTDDAIWSSYVKFLRATEDISDKPEEQDDDSDQDDNDQDDNDQDTPSNSDDSGSSDSPGGGSPSGGDPNTQPHTGGGSHMPEFYYYRLAEVESSHNPLAKNPNSSAKGLYQFIDSTGKQYGLDPGKFGTSQYTQDESVAVRQFTNDNYNSLVKSIGRQPSLGEMYLAHQQGPGGAAKLLNNPGGSAVATVGADAVTLNGGHAGMTNQEFANLWIKKFESGLDETKNDPWLNGSQDSIPPSPVSSGGSSGSSGGSSGGSSDDYQPKGSAGDDDEDKIDEEEAKKKAEEEAAKKIEEEAKNADVDVGNSDDTDKETYRPKFEKDKDDKNYRPRFEKERDEEERNKEEEKDERDLVESLADKANLNVIDILKVLVEKAPLNENQLNALKKILFKVTGEEEYKAEGQESVIKSYGDDALYDESATKPSIYEQAAERYGQYKKAMKFDNFVVQKVGKLLPDLEGKITDYIESHYPDLGQENQAHLFTKIVEKNYSHIFDQVKINYENEVGKIGHDDMKYQKADIKDIFENNDKQLDNLIHQHNHDQGKSHSHNSGDGYAVNGMFDDVFEVPASDVPNNQEIV